MSEEPKMKIEKILEVLPHRFPFVMVDRVQQLVTGERILATKLVSAGEPWSQGHFPGRPIMPGVLIVEALAQAGGLLAFSSYDQDMAGQVVLFLGIDKARFRRMVVPGDVLSLDVEVTRRRGDLWKFKGRATVDGEVCAEAELMATVAKGDAG